jgi:uncharacterized phiE125 gp8 family phage protein
VLPPASAAVFLGEIKSHLKQDHNDDDASIAAYILTAAEQIQNHCGVALLTQTLIAIFDGFDCRIILPRAPVQQVVKIEYLLEGVWTVIPSADYRLESGSTPAFLRPSFGKNWPSHDGDFGAVRIEFVAGYLSSNLVPDVLKHALKLLVEQSYDSSKDYMNTVDELLSTHRLFLI